MFIITSVSFLTIGTIVVLLIIIVAVVVFLCVFVHRKKKKKSVTINIKVCQFILNNINMFHVIKHILKLYFMALWTVK